jgi:uncharacterized protein
MFKPFLINMRKLLLIIVVMLLPVATLSAAAQERPEIRVVKAAREQVGKTLRYDPGYQTLAYPGGDVPFDRGVCSDVVLRAYRAALQVDLQELIHVDMTRNFAVYPRLWGMKRPDSSIDHRRVPNLQTYFKRMGYGLGVSDEAKDYKPGDLVTCTVPPNLPHIMIVSDRTNAKGIPLVIHNIGAGAKEEDRLFEFPLTGHYRVKAVQPRDRREMKDRAR